MKYCHDSPLQSQKLQFVHWVVALSFVQRVASILDHMFLTINYMIKDHPQAYPIGIGVKDEWLFKVHKSQNGSGAAKVFHFVKDHLTLISPLLWLVFLTGIVFPD